MSKPGAAFVRVSTGSQDESSQLKVIAAYAADLDAQAEILLAISTAGGDVISIAEPQFGKTDFAGRIVTLVAQHANAEKSRTVKQMTYRGVCMIRDNGAHHGSLPPFWANRGERYARQAYCADPDAVRDIYERVAAGESISSVGRSHVNPRFGKSLYPNSVTLLVRFTANHTGVIECRYTYGGHTETWAHEVAPVVGSSLWWRANRVLDANLTQFRANRGGRPVARPANWVSGILDCPGCGGKLYIHTGLTAAGNPRTMKLACMGTARDRASCRRFTPVAAQPVMDVIESVFRGDTTPVLAFQRVTGNAHELDALNAGLRRIQARLSATEDDDRLDALVAERKAVKARIEGFAMVPDSFDYAPTGQTVDGMWGGDDAVSGAWSRPSRARGAWCWPSTRGSGESPSGRQAQGARGTRTGSWTLATGCASGARARARGCGLARACARWPGSHRGARARAQTGTARPCGVRE